MLSQNWVPPLPRGYEARYDSNQERYFFINHATKKTQWEDPRFPSASSNAAAAASSLGHSQRSSQSAHSRPSSEAVQMHAINTNSHGHDSTSNHQQEESSLTNTANIAVITKLHQQFPKASKDFILDLFVLCHENENKTRQQLKELGFARTKPQPQQQRHSPANRPAEPEVMPAATPKVEVPEAEKRRILAQMKSQFPLLDLDVIRIALDMTEFNVNKTNTLLSAWKTKEKTGTASISRAATASGASSSASSSQPRTEPLQQPTAQSLEPAGLTDDAATAPRVASITIQMGNQGREASPSHQPQHLKAKQVTRTRRKRTAKKTPTVVTSQPPPAQTSTSAHNSGAKGPDASLCSGTDKSLLISSYTNANGSDRSLRYGPDVNRICGPLGAMGVDATLRCGAQASLLLKHQSLLPVTVTDL